MHIHNHILSPSIFRTRGLFKTLWNIDQAYSEPCHRALFSYILVYSEPCGMLAYTETWHTRNPRIFSTLRWLHPDTYVNENLQIFKTLTYLKPDAYSEPSQRFKIDFLHKLLKTILTFSKRFILDISVKIH